MKSFHNRKNGRGAASRGDQPDCGLNEGEMIRRRIARENKSNMSGLDSAGRRLADHSASGSSSEGSLASELEFRSRRKSIRNNRGKQVNRKSSRNKHDRVATANHASRRQGVTSQPRGLSRDEPTLK